MTEEKRLDENRIEFIRTNYKRITNQELLTKNQIKLCERNAKAMLPNTQEPNNPILTHWVATGLANQEP